MADDPYTVLGVARDATPDAIKQAYRKLARRHHPDLNPGKPQAEAAFKRVSAANALLADPEQRARFDRGEIDAEGQEMPPAGFQHRHHPAGGYRRHAESAAGERYGTAGEDVDLGSAFAEFFEARRRADAAPRPGEDAAYRLEVPFLSAVLGATETLTLPEGRTLSVRIPAGVTSGQVLRLRGQGGPGHRGGPPGDALIELAVTPHPRLRREGFDLHMALPVTLREAVLGGPILVPTPAGAVRVTLPPGSDGGRSIRLRGKGVAAEGKRPAGDLLLTPQIVLGAADGALNAFLEGWTPETPADPRAGLEFG
jgi:DnaJ-class molecular chaperone